MTLRARGGAIGVRLALLNSFVLAFVACSNDDLRGTYEVEFHLPRIGVPIHGTLVLGSRSLDVDPAAPIVPNKVGGGPIDDGDDLLLDPNSCLVITSARSKTPHSVMLFQVRARTDGIDLPFGLFDNGEERIEVEALRLFANALGGDVAFVDAEGRGSGRLYGDRQGEADELDCEQAYASFIEARIAEKRANAASGSTSGSR